MYLNEKSWEIHTEDSYKISESIKRFLNIYKILAGEFHIDSVYVPSEKEPYLRTISYSIAKWLAEVDVEYKRLYLSFLNKRVVYEEEDECEVSYQGEVLQGGTEAVLNDSFMMSLDLEDNWQKAEIRAKLFSVTDDYETDVVIPNVYRSQQLTETSVSSILKRMKRVLLYSYEELWERRTELFPHLVFCPSVKKDMNKLDKTSLQQIIRKLRELEEYISHNGTKNFNPKLLTKTTPESEVTLEQHQKEHTFRDEEGKEYLASWHMRYTGVTGRIFFVPEYAENKMLICYIGKKLPNVTYS